MRFVWPIAAAKTVSESFTSGLWVIQRCATPAASAFAIIATRVGASAAAIATPTRSRRVRLVAGFGRSSCCCVIDSSPYPWLAYILTPGVGRRVSQQFSGFVDAKQGVEVAEAFPQRHIGI